MSSEDSSSESEAGESVFIVEHNPETEASEEPSSSYKKQRHQVDLKTSKNARCSKLASSLDPGIKLPDTYISIFPERNPGDLQQKLKSLSAKGSRDELLQKSALHQPGFEKQFTVAPYIEGRKKIRRERLKERDKTKGKNWFNLPATELTEERKNDLMVLQMRNALDPKRFYKRNTDKTLPKYFRIGTIVEAPIDFYHARIPKCQRKQTLVDELLADAEFRRYQKQKIAEAIKNQPKKVYFSKKKKAKRLGFQHSEGQKTRTKKVKK